MKFRKSVRRLGLRLGLLPDNRPHNPNAEMDLGDRYRGVGDWPKAAKHYEIHVTKFPDDFAAWVQLGHAFKESANLEAAAAAYATAHALRPDDTDLQINRAHLKKIVGDLAGAAELYGDCAVRGDKQALSELASPEIAPHVSAQQQALLLQALEVATGPLTCGLKLEAAQAMRPQSDGRFESVSFDPWLEFSLLPDTAAGQLAELEICFSDCAGQFTCTSQIYVDYGEGYNERESLILAKPEGGRIRLILPMPSRIRSLRWDPDNKPEVMLITSIRLRRIDDIERVIAQLAATYPADLDVHEDLDDARRFIMRDDLTSGQAMDLMRFLTFGGFASVFEYASWHRRWVDPRPADYARIEDMTKAFTATPKFSFVMPVYNPPPELLRECIESMLAQTYPNFEICIADDRSTVPEIGRILAEFQARDPRVKVVMRPTNGHISAASNSALALATGDFIALVDHDDLIPDYCLFVVCHYLNIYPNAKILYSDEDKIRQDGERYEPYFKSCFDNFLMYGHNMVSHLGVYSRELVESIGGFRQGYEGSQDYDLFLRALDIAGEAAIVHIPHVLYHWRAIEGSTALAADQKSYAVVAAQKAINDHFQRTGSTLKSVDGPSSGSNAVSPTRDYDTLVSIIIPTRDGLEDLQACVNSILAVNHDNVEILIVDNGSILQETLDYLRELSNARTARIIDFPGEFNFSNINNAAVEHASGDILCFLNNDTEVVSGDWLSRARTLLAQKSVGIVGARLLYPDRTVQHFGVVTGMAEHGVAGTPHVGLLADQPGYFSKAQLIQQFSAVTAACMFVRHDAFSAVGGFDSALRVAYNDVDLCLKIKAAGFKIVCDPDLVLIHKESKTRGSDATGEKRKRLDAEAAIMRARWATALDNDPFYSPNHDLAHGEFRLANPPRVQMPWKSGAENFRTHPRVPASTATR